MIQVIISGAGGKLATAIAEAVLVADDLELSGFFNPNRMGRSLLGVTVSADPGSLAPFDYDEFLVEPHLVKEDLPAELTTDSGASWGKLQNLES